MRTPPPPDRQRTVKALKHDECGAFTITELLIVIGVIIILCALAAPVLMRGIEQSRAVECVAKLRHLAVVHREWRMENNEQLWNQTILDVRPSRILWDAGKIRSAAEMQCPSAKRSDQKAWIDSPGGALTTPYKREFTATLISYGTNRFAIDRTPVSGTNKMRTSYREYLGVESKVPLFADGTIWNLDRTTWNDHTERSRVDRRHGGKANVAFLDGHVESLDKAGVLGLSPVGEIKDTY